MIWFTYTIQNFQQRLHPKINFCPRLFHNCSLPPSACSNSRQQSSPPPSIPPTAVSAHETHHLSSPSAGRADEPNAFEQKCTEQPAKLPIDQPPAQTESTQPIRNVSSIPIMCQRQKSCCFKLSRDNALSCEERARFLLKPSE